MTQKLRTNLGVVVRALGVLADELAIQLSQWAEQGQGSATKHTFPRFEPAPASNWLTYIVELRVQAHHQRHVVENARVLGLDHLFASSSMRWR
jgi:hypothetical protein